MPPLLPDPRRSPRDHPPEPGRFRCLRRGARVVPMLLVLGGCGAGPREAVSDESTARALLGERFTLGRLAGQDAWEPCTVADSTALVPRVVCEGSPRPGTRRFPRVSGTSPTARGAEDAAPDALHGQAIVDLRWQGSAPGRTDQAAAALERALGRAPNDAAILNDLSVVYLEIAQRDQQIRPLLRALNAADRALAIDSTMAAALFNRAIILQRLYLLHSAERAWLRYRAVEQSPRWRAEAQAHLRGIRIYANPLPLETLLAAPPGFPAGEAGLVARVRWAPQEARELGFRLLTEWGGAVREGDEAAAARALSRARRIAAAAESMRGDLSVLLALRGIDRVANDSAAVRTLARAHARYGAGVALWEQAAYEQAADSLARAERDLRALGSPAAGWAAYYHAGSHLGQGRFDRADSIFRRALAGAGPTEPALAGKVTWARGVVHVRRGHYEMANRYYRQAAPFIARAKEPENLGAIAYLLAEGLGLAGQSVAAGNEGLRGLRLLSPYRRLGHLNNHLATVAAYARAEGLSHAALSVMNEVLEVSRGIGRREVMAWTLCARARDQAAVGRMRDARADLEEARRWADAMHDGKGRDRVRADVMLARGQVAPPADPHDALALFSEVVKAYRRVNIEIHLPDALYASARAARALGDLPGARRGLREAIERIERQQETFRSAEMRATRYETAENVFDEMIALELEDGRATSAFDYLERSRVAAWPPGDRLSPASAGVPPATLSRIAARLPHDMLLVEYALLDDRVAVWSVSRRGWRHHSVPVSRDTVAALAERFARELERGETGAADARARLFDVLLRPLQPQMAGMRALTVVPDRELNRIPFAALWEKEAGRYVVQDYEVSTVPSAAFFAAAGRGASAAGGHGGALIVGNPALDARATGPLPPLPGAAREAERVARLYGGTLLTGAGARRTDVVQQLPATGLFHFAGHAVFNPDQPELSYLALAPEPGVDDDGMLHAWEIGRLRLSNLRAVILSACSTLSPRPSRAGPTAGLAYSFLRAGAPATVSTLWDVTDDATTELLVEFHREFAAGAPAPRALRAAQLQALASPRPELRAPRAWAAFIYTGP